MPNKVPSTAASPGVRLVRPALPSRLTLQSTATLGKLPSVNGFNPRDSVGPNAHPAYDRG